ncbi:MAG: hypothetical protein LUE10_03245, partial [Alistipes sp.]|nr:hypothetical protein [Alistipes sp.]
TSQANPAPKIFREDCYIRWGDNIDDIYNHIRGLSPYPAAWGYLVRNAGPECVTSELNEEDERSKSYCPAGNSLPEDTQQVKVYRARKEYNDHPGVYGSIVTDGKSFMKVACRGGYIEILEVQAAGKKRMETAEFLKGFKAVAEYSFA